MCRLWWCVRYACRWRKSPARAGDLVSTCSPVTSGRAMKGPRIMVAQTGLEVTKRRTTYDRAEIFRLIDSGLSQGEVSRRLGVNQGHVSKLLKRRRLTSANGHHPTAL